MPGGNRRGQIPAGGECRGDQVFDRGVELNHAVQTVQRNSGQLFPVLLHEEFAQGNILPLPVFLILFVWVQQQPDPGQNLRIRKRYIVVPPVGVFQCERQAVGIGGAHIQRVGCDGGLFKGKGTQRHIGLGEFKESGCRGIVGGVVPGQQGSAVFGVRKDFQFQPPGACAVLYGGFIFSRGAHRHSFFSPLNTRSG